MKLQATTSKKRRIVTNSATAIGLTARVIHREVDKASAITATLLTLSPEIGRHRVLDAAASATYWGVSLPHWRRLYRAGKVPRPIKIGERKLGWRVGDLVDGLAQRAEAAA